MRVLMIGDVVGHAGCNVILERLREIQQDYQIDFTVANVENAAAGFGLLPYIAEDLLAAGVDIMTSGNHIFDKRDIINYIKDQPRLLRPANYAEGVPGTGIWVGKTRDDIDIAVINVQGRVFMPPTDCPFRTVDRLLAPLKDKVAVILVDHHAEATSEKVAMGRYLDGRVSAVVGTHTHVQTADDQILAEGTAYITDLGMTGPYDSVIGMDKDGIIDRFLHGMPRKMETASQGTYLSGVVINIADSGQAVSINRVRIPYD